MPQFLKIRTKIALASVTDSTTGQTRKYYYDFLDRPVKYTEEGGTGLNSHAVLYNYDKINNLAQRQETINNETWSTSVPLPQAMPNPPRSSTIPPSGVWTAAGSGSV